MSNFTTLMRRADTLRRLESDPLKFDWWVGYMRGLRRAHHGERFGTESEHQLWLDAMWLDAINATDPSRAALGHGYAAGLSLTACQPPEIDATLPAVG